LHPFHDDTNAEICSELSLKVLYLLSYPLVNILLPNREFQLELQIPRRGRATGKVIVETSLNRYSTSKPGERPSMVAVVIALPESLLFAPLPPTRAVNPGILMGTELIFEVHDAEESGYCVRALGPGIFTEAETWEELRANVLEAISVHFEDGPVNPRLVRLHYVKDEPI
jgi:predicted RNase H-like HicB family nuclease